MKKIPLLKKSLHYIWGWSIVSSSNSWWHDVVDHHCYQQPLTHCSQSPPAFALLLTAQPDKQEQSNRKLSICLLSASYKSIAVWFRQLKSLSFVSVCYLERGQHLVGLLIGTGGNGVSGVAVRIDDRVASFPADDDGPFSPGCAVQLLHVTLLGHSSVRVTCDHCGNWKEKWNEVWDEEKVSEGRNDDYNKQID